MAKWLLYRSHVLLFICKIMPGGVNMAAASEVEGLSHRFTLNPTCSDFVKPEGKDPIAIFFDKVVTGKVIGVRETGFPGN